MVQALGATDALGNLKVGELKDYCKQHGVKTAGAKLDMIKALGKVVLAKFGSRGEEEPPSSGRGVKRRPAAATSSIEPPSRRTRHLVKQRPAAAEPAVGIAAGFQQRGASLPPSAQLVPTASSATAATFTLAPISSAPASSAPSEDAPMPGSLETMTVQELRSRCDDMELPQAGKKSELVDRIIQGSPKAVAALPREPAAMSLVVTSSLGREGSRTIEFRAAGNETAGNETAA
eukprot:CAMPEP_0172917260 /NCGR_PEP_ID=MMETSP1075-20121228/197984_1 /TAXON_ID=2916 /ORGANISM="Ceratium fusus, Strain PA161109" /LENGTH=232 /DNA_ID=CAMNT_0013776699 /DNA_START=1 /DNA_END=695 /DNA_ORIENTATION=+